MLLTLLYGQHAGSNTDTGTHAYDGAPADTPTQASTQANTARQTCLLANMEEQYQIPDIRKCGNQQQSNDQHWLNQFGFLSQTRVKRRKKTKKNNESEKAL